MNKENKIRVAIVYNHTGEDVYEKNRDIDPATLGFEPEYNINVATVTEEYEAIANALSKEGYETELLNIREDIQVLIDLLTKNIFTLWSSIYRCGTIHTCIVPEKGNDQAITFSQQCSDTKI